MVLLRWLRKAYFFIFYVQVRCASSFGNAKRAEENAVYGMAILQIILILDAICGIALLTGHAPIVIPKLWTVAGALSILLFTYAVFFIRNHRWLSYKAEFAQYPRRKHFFASLTVGILMAGSIAAMGLLRRAITG
jgi:hypothetical protein